MLVLEALAAGLSWLSSYPLTPFPFSSASLSTTPKSTCESFVLTHSSVSAVLLSATHYPANHTLDLHSSSGRVNASSFAAFCRLEYSVHTNPASNSKATAVTEVWLPDASGWSGRLVGFGNAGWSGGVNYGDLAYIGLRGGHAGMSTNGGHHSNSSNGAWALNDPDALVDFGGRAMHLSVLLAKEVVKEYYGTAAGKSYYVGCSTGGREGLKAVQDYPTDFDGVAVGSPANWLSHMHPWSLYIQLQILPESSPQWIPVALWERLHELVLQQCDDIDGVHDGIINDPRVCPFWPEAIACSAGQQPCDASETHCTCLNEEQLAAIHVIYDTLTMDGEYIFGPLMMGGELEYPHGLLGPKPFETAIDYFKYMVLNDTKWKETDLDFTDIQTADAIDPGNMNAIKTDLTAFAGKSHGGKLIQYVGWADQYISPMNSVHYYHTVSDGMSENSDLQIEEYYRLFLVPGMQHCYGGVGPNAFGGAQQAEKGMPPGKNDSSHDVLLALIEWVEDGIAPNSFIATKYKDDDLSKDVEMTRPICQLGQVLVYSGAGNVNQSSNWSCK
ncbi:tannase and feruloyl esterase [Calocera cornea HHB12733]|uniref:Carboxylic ester hydrolase n=1 Tax=Calocera cornea HHB12733 TaxID=1353952 RepID=A0A165GQG7_9BASI|nr:tannase and feruloyl esterase [Calocera cornea HHB12733]